MTTIEQAVYHNQQELLAIRAQLASRVLKKKSRSVSRPRMVAELVVATIEPGSLRECFGTSLESKWKNLRRGCNSWERKWVDSEQ